MSTFLCRQLYQFSGTRKVGSGYPTDSTCLYLGLCGWYCEFVHGSTATGSVPLILALGGPPLLGLGVRPPRSVSHLYPLLTLMLRVLRCLASPVVSVCTLGVSLL